MKNTLPLESLVITALNDKMKQLSKDYQWWKFWKEQPTTGTIKVYYDDEEKVEYELTWYSN